jgi:hypothetical protein
VEGATSDTVPVVSGVPQETVLEPLLFLIFINDFPNCVQSRIQLFADDFILYRKIRSNEDTIILQDDLNKLVDWEQKWGMDFYPDKCSTLHVTRSRTPILQDYILKGHKLREQPFNLKGFLY